MNQTIPKNSTARYLVPVVAIVVVGAVAIVGFLVLSPQPNIRAVEVTHHVLPFYTKTEGGIFGFGAKCVAQTWQVTFTLVNTGSATGFATVELIVDGKGTNRGQTYFIEANSQLGRSLSTEMQDCDDHTFDVEVIRVSR